MDSTIICSKCFCLKNEPSIKTAALLFYNDDYVKWIYIDSDLITLAYLFNLPIINTLSAYYINVADSKFIALRFIVGLGGCRLKVWKSQIQIEHTCLAKPTLRSVKLQLVS